jgi:hypothetical protein
LTFCRGVGVDLLPGPSANSLLGCKPSKLKRQLEACKNKGKQQIMPEAMLIAEACFDFQ